jgi:hypothetical protein
MAIGQGSTGVPATVLMGSGRPVATYRAPGTAMPQPSQYWLLQLNGAESQNTEDPENDRQPSLPEKCFPQISYSRIQMDC